MSDWLLFHFFVWFILFPKITSLIDSFILNLKLKYSLTIINIRRGLWKATSHASLLTFGSLHFILFHLLHGWSMLRIFKLISYLSPKLSKTSTCERIVIFLFVCSVFKKILKLNIKIVVFINNWMLNNWLLIDSVTTELIIENVELVKVVLLIF
jgi:hypothetical protein